MLPTIDDVRAAAERIAGHIHRTPIVTSATLDRELGLAAFFKCENFQKVGAFKARGALNAVLSLGDETARGGVVTHSSGNHGQALAYAASVRSIPCTVVMPEDAPKVKLDAVAGYGARVVVGPRTAREELAASCRRAGNAAAAGSSSAAASSSRRHAAASTSASRSFPNGSKTFGSSA